MDGESLQPGQLLEGKYEVRRVLGAGAMGMVFEGHHRLLDKPVAIKVLRPELTENEGIRGRFEAEARAAAAVAHPNIVAVTDMGRTDDGAIYFVMDRLNGETLGSASRARGASSGGRRRHRAGGAHRPRGGRTPSASSTGISSRTSVFLTLGPGRTETAKILDFGVAKALAAVGKRAGDGTAVGMAIGRPSTWRPKQARGRPTSTRAWTSTRPA